MKRERRGEGGGGGGGGVSKSFLVVKSKFEISAKELQLPQCLLHCSPPGGGPPEGHELELAGQGLLLLLHDHHAPPHHTAPQCNH